MEKSCSFLLRQPGGVDLWVCIQNMSFMQNSLHCMCGNRKVYKATETKGVKTLGPVHLDCFGNSNNSEPLESHKGFLKIQNFLIF